MAEITGGTRVAGFISPTDTNDTYPVIDPIYGIDGFRNVSTINDMNSIPNLRRRVGMVVGVSGGTDYYKLKVEPWSGITADWEPFFITGIGEAEDGDYTDGLFVDFTADTPIGTVVDRYNEILKAVAPPPAPSLDNIQSTVANSSKLSFGGTRNDITYVNVSGSTIGSSDVDINSLYSASGDVLGVTNTQITGVLNEDVPVDTGTPIPSYSANTFGDADKGYLTLEVNGIEVNRLSLTATTATTSNILSGTTLDVSASSLVKFITGVELSLFIYRSGTYTISTSAMTAGWNYAQVKHNNGSSEVLTNYIEWVYDTDLNNISLSSNTLTNLLLSGSKFISGIEYYTSGSVDYTGIISNAYRNVYSNGNAISFPTRTNLADSVSIGITGTGITNRLAANDKTLPALDTAQNNPETTNINIVGTMVINGTKILGNVGTTGKIESNIGVTHPISSKNYSGGADNITDFLFYNITQSANEESEDLTGEIRRIETRDYTALTYANIDGGTYDWTSTEDIITGNTEHNTGLLVFDGQLLYPNSTGLTSTYGITIGNFNSVTNAPINNPNYSGATGIREYNRRFKSNNVSTQSTITFQITHTGTDASFLTDADDGGTPSGNNIKFEFMIKRVGGTTYGYFNPFYLGGGQVYGVSQTSVGHSSGITTIVTTLASLRIANTDIVVVRIKAESGFTNKITNIAITNI